MQELDTFTSWTSFLRKPLEDVLHQNEGMTRKKHRTPESGKKESITGERQQEAPAQKLPLKFQRLQEHGPDVQGQKPPIGSLLDV